MQNWSVIIFLGVCALGAFFMGLNIYNGLVNLKNQVQRAWANIDVVLKQRFDEIPQLVQIVEQYAGYESGVLQSLAEARQHYGQARSVKDKQNAANELSVALGGVLAIGEAYPELKANEKFLQLQSRVSRLEEIIADRREVYNEAATNFNSRIEQFPDVFVARFLNYNRQDLFFITEAEKQIPSVKMSLPQFKKSS